MKIKINEDQAKFLQALMTEKESLEKRINDIVLFALQGSKVDFEKVSGVKLENNELLINLKEDGGII